MVKKEYLSSVLADLKQEQKAIRKYLKCYEHYDEKESTFFSKEKYRNILQNAGNIRGNVGDGDEHQRNMNHPENLRFNSISGNVVRSKSELMIDQLLFANELEFFYEHLLCLGGVNVYPDFTIRHPYTKKIIYWEHFGMMDSPEYAQSAFLKLQRFIDAGIVPGVNLITTYETKEYPLDTQRVKDMIDLYLR